MGCSSSKGPDVVKGNISPDDCDRKSTRRPDSQQTEAEDDLFVSVEEAAMFLQQEQDMSDDKARRLVDTLEHTADGLVSSVQLVMLGERIKDIKDQLIPRFEEYDSDGTGFVDPEEAVAILETVFTGLPVSSLRSMLKRYDRDNDNKVDIGEFLEFYSSVKAKRDTLEAKFEALDVDQSGDLGAEELVETLVNECAIEEFMARSLVDDFDINHNGTLDKDEFMGMWIRLFG